MSAIEVTDLTKDYGDVLANDEVTFSVDQGEVFGYLGPNGAGKTTTIRTLLGFQSPTAGSATLLDANVREEDELIDAKRRTGYLPATPSFDETATGRRVLDLHASVKGDERRSELLDLFDPPLDRPIRDYSTGNAQKLGLVQAFMHDPDLVVLDEPTSGLDPLMQRRFEEFVRAERARGSTVFLSSHVLSEVRRLCDRVGIIRDGRIVTVERVRDLLGRSGKAVRARVAGTLEPDDVSLDGVHDVAARTVEEARDDTAVGGGVDAKAATDLSFTYTGDVNELAAFLAGLDLIELDVSEAPLEDVFMRFYGDE